MMELHRRYRDEIFSGDIVPVGSEPDGKSITGFHATSGFLILYRERNAPESAELDIPGGWELIAGNGLFDGVRAVLPESGSFAWFKRR